MQNYLFRMDVIKLMGVSRLQLDRMVKRGTFPPPRVLNGRLCWESSDLEHWISQSLFPDDPFPAFEEKPKRQARMPSANILEFE